MRWGHPWRLICHYRISIEQKTLNNTPRKKKLKKELFVQKEEKKLWKESWTWLNGIWALSTTGRIDHFIQLNCKGTCTRVMDSFPQYIYSLIRWQISPENQTNRNGNALSSKIELLDKIQEKLGARTSEKSKAKRVVKRSKDRLQSKKNIWKKRTTLSQAYRIRKGHAAQRNRKVKAAIEKNV